MNLSDRNPETGRQQPAGDRGWLIILGVYALVIGLIAWGLVTWP